MGWVIVQLFHEACRDVRHMGKQVPAAGCVAPSAPIPGWTLALRTALLGSAPQSRECPLTTGGRLTHPQTGRKAAGANLLR